MEKVNLRGFAVLVVSIACLIVAGCEGSEGPTGPQGEPGPQGPQGEQGPEGPQGTANVIYSEWIEFDVSNWSEAYSVFGQMRRDYPISEPAIDEDILSMGTVVVYARIPGQASISGKVFHLPWIYNITKGLAQVLGFELSLETIVIYFHDLVDQTVDPGSFGSQVVYRYVIIPGGTPAKINPPDFNDYYAVMEYYDIVP